MKIHGAAAMAFLIVFGALLFQHVPDGWGEKRQRATGSGLVVFCSFLILTGWGLYYFGNESLRRITSLAHSLIGGLVPAFLLVHILLGRRHR